MSRPSALCPVCQTRFASGNCVHVNEDGGTPSDPYVFTPIISPQSGNMVECGPGGLGAFTKQIYRDPPACCAYLTVDQPIGWDVVQGIPFNEERYDTDGMHDSEDLGTSNRLTVKTPGLYLFTLNVMWNKTNDSTFTGDFAAFIRVNGGKFIALDSFPVGDGDLYAAHSLSVQYPMAAGDFVDAMVKQDIVDADGEPKVMTVVAERNSPVFAATYLRSISGMTIVGVDTEDVPDAGGGGVGSEFCLNGTTQYWSTPDHASLDITGDIDLRAAVALDDWTPVPSAEGLLSKYASGGNQRGYGIYIGNSPAGTPVLIWSADGSSTIEKNPGVVVPASDGQPIGLRATLDVDNGSSQNEVKFYTKSITLATALTDIASDSGWTQLGTTQTTAGVTSIFSNSASLKIGNHNDAFFLDGCLYAAVIKNGINGTTVANPDFYHNNSPFTDGSGRLWTKT